MRRMMSIMHKFKCLLDIADHPQKKLTHYNQEKVVNISRRGRTYRQEQTAHQHQEKQQFLAKVCLGFSYNFIVHHMSRKESKRQGADKASKKGNSKKSVLAEPIPDELRLAKEKELVSLFNQENIHRYLQSLEQNSYSDVVASRAINGSLSSIDWQFRHGLIDLPNDPLPLPKPISQALKLTYEEVKEQQIRAKREELQKKIGYLQQQIRGDSSKLHSGLSVSVKEVLSKDEHEQKIRQIISEKAELKKRQEESAEQNARKKKEMEDREEELRALEVSKQRERKRSCIELNMKKRKEEHDKFVEMQKEMHKKFQQLRGNECLYQKMEQKYHSEVLLPFLEEKKNKLKQLREFHKGYEIDAIKEHEKKYTSEHVEKEKEKQLEQSQTKETHYHPPLRSERLNRLLAEQAQLLKEKLNSRKNHNEQMLKRMQLFEREVLSKRRPKIDEDKKKEITQRYLEEDRKQQRLSIDSRKLGQNYMQIAKKMRRSESHRKQYNSEKDVRLKGEAEKAGSTLMQLSRATHRDQDFYQNLRRKRIEQILNSEQNTNKEKYRMLKLQTEKISEKIKQKEDLARLGANEKAQEEAAELLLSSIQAKMGIMNILKGGQSNS